MKKWLILFVVFFIGFFSAFAGEKKVKSEVHNDWGKYGIGFQSTYPAWGLAGTMNINEKISVDAIIAPIGSLSYFGGRAKYVFREGKEVEDILSQYRFYGVAGIGVWIWSYDNFDWTTGKTYTDHETAFGFSVGAGIEYKIKGFDLLTFNTELALGIGSLGYWDSSVHLDWGVGFRYYF